MILNQNNEYEGVNVHLDGKGFKRCVFTNCRLIFDGTGPVSLVECEFTDVAWEFTGPAKNTLAFLGALYHGMGESGKKVVESTFEHLRSGNTS